MGIRDRDYMKHRTDADEERGSSLESKMEAIAERIMVRGGKVILVVCVALGILALVVWIVCRG